MWVGPESSHGPRRQRSAHTMAGESAGEAVRAWLSPAIPPAHCHRDGSRRGPLAALRVATKHYTYHSTEDTGIPKHKLTLRIDEDIIRWAKCVTRNRGNSLSWLVEEGLRRLLEERSESTPLVAKLRATLPDDTASKTYQKYLKKKHGMYAGDLPPNASLPASFLRKA